MKQESTGYVLNGVSAIFTVIQPNPILGYISLGVTILSSLVSIAYTVYKFVERRKAKKLTQEDIKEAHDEIKEHLDNIQESIKGVNSND